MGIISKPNKSFVLRGEILALKAKWDQSTAVKTLLTTAALIAGIAAILFLSSNFLSVGITVIVVSSLVIYQFLNHHRQTQKIFSLINFSKHNIKNF